MADVQRHIDDPSVPFDYFCWDLYSRMAAYYQENPEAQQWRRDTLHRIEHQEGETARLAALIARADAAMYEAKRDGGRGLVIHP